MLYMLQISNEPTNQKDNSMSTTSAKIIHLRSPIDTLGALRARIAVLEAEEAVIVSVIKNYGPGVYPGDLYSATVSDIPGRETLDVKACEEKLRDLGVDGRWFSRNTKVGKASLRLSLQDR